MGEAADREFILLCEAILDDGEVSADEAYRLAQWLNEHPTVARDELTRSLQEIWADGTVNRRELQRVARLLVRLQRERGKRDEPSAAHVAQIPLPSFFSAAEGGARLPSVDAQLRIVASRDSAVSYEVDLTEPRCNCAEWRERRSHLPRGHLTRCCKHILAAYAQLPRTSPVEEWLLAFIDHGWPADPRTDWELIAVEKEKVLISNAANKGWANVFARDEGEYKRFGYNPEEHRWAYNSEPRWAWVITDAIRSLNETAKAHRPTRVIAKNESQTSDEAPGLFARFLSRFRKS